jgi:transcriptional regulator with XRE-family HTH domain
VLTLPAMANRLAEYLADQGVTQAELCRLSGLPAPMMSEYVNGNRRPGLDAAFAIEKATDGKVPARYWLGIGPIRDARKAI